ncbi:hypothetical protein ONZ45_g4407 [Pleurotus djamor]|nr:hypothetical protein ONZ45_g4407 [Pleurotus djamor]
MQPIRFLPNNINKLILPFLGNGRRNLTYDSAFDLSNNDHYQDIIVTNTLTEYDIPLRRPPEHQKALYITVLPGVPTPNLTPDDTKLLIIGADHHVVPVRLAIVNSTNGRSNQITLDSTHGPCNPLHNNSIVVHHQLGFGFIQGVWECYANKIALLVGFRADVHDTDIVAWVLLWVPRETVYLGMEEIAEYEFQRASNSGKFERGSIIKLDAGYRWILGSLDETRKTDGLSPQAMQAWTDFICG